MRDAERPEDSDADRRDRSGDRVEPEQVGVEHREAGNQEHRGDGGREHRGGDDGVSGHHGSDFTVPHDGARPALQPKKPKTKSR